MMTVSDGRMNSSTRLRRLPGGSPEAIDEGDRGLCLQYSLQTIFLRGVVHAGEKNAILRFPPPFGQEPGQGRRGLHVPNFLRFVFGGAPERAQERRDAGSLDDGRG